MFNKKGFSFLITVFISAVLLIQIGFLVRCLTLFNKNTILEYYRLKTFYIAKSGLAVFPDVWKDVPSFTGFLDKEKLYQSAQTGLFIPHLEGELYLLKGKNSVFWSIAFVEHHYRRVIQAEYSLQNNVPTIENWRVLE